MLRLTWRVQLLGFVCFGCLLAAILSQGSLGGEEGPRLASASTEEVDSTRAPSTSRSTRPNAMTLRGPARELAIFSRSRTERDVLPSELTHTLRDAYEHDDGLEDTSSSSDEEPGPLLIDESRLALERAGQFHFDHYLVPTRNGWICQAIVSAEHGYEASVCDSGLLNEGVTTANYEPSGTASILFGIVEDRVQAATLTRGKETFAAAVGENAFLVEVPNGRHEQKYPDLIELEYDDGRTRNVELASQGFLRIRLSAD
jgi:hypothetical protein